MRDTRQSRAVLLTLLLVGATAGGVVSLATAASVSPFTAQTDSQDDLSASVETYNGQIAVEDSVIRVSGSSSGGDVVVVFVGSRGTVVTSALPVSGDQFSATLDVAEIEEGFVDGVVLSSGSDGLFGTPGDDPDSSDELVDYANELGDRDLTQDQVREVLLGATVNGGGSDDLAVETSFVLTQGDIRINDVVPASDRQASGVQPIPVGETMVVRGVTNRRPSSLLIEVMIEAPDGDQFDVTTVDDWDTDGVWEVELTVPSDALPGTYMVEADDGEQSARADVEVVAASTSTPTATTEPTTPADATSTATVAPTQTTTPTQTTAPTQTTVAGSEPTPEPTPDPTTTETQSPGFGLLVAVVALAVAAVTLVGLRRDDDDA